MEQEWLRLVAEALEGMRQSGWHGVAWFVGLYAVSCVLFLPGSALSLGAGAVYGFWLGTVVVLVSSTVGAQVNFLMARYLLRGWLRRVVGSSPKFLSLDRAVQREGWKIILVSRISPVVPHSLVSYLAGLTRISGWRFLVASLGGFLPMSVFYCYAGAFLGAVARGGAGLSAQDPVIWLLYALGLVCTVGVVWWSGKLAGQALRRSVPEEE